ncbi:DNA-binding protein [Rhypophila decipiens]|uniref:DNA-binding protein n=1 Tax=Rhypophila decipiens TaxID=261697 RepID=A0AAN6Y559_9PEZI|nr:DNA-binding protein [Rhypophila decipiens]
MPPPVPGQPTTTTVDEAHVLLTSFNSFLTVAVHNILFYRNIYPQDTFLTAKAFNLPVHQNRHPKVCSWINDAVSAVGEQIAGGNVARVAVVIHSPMHTIYPSFASSRSPAKGSNQNEKDDDNEDDDQDEDIPMTGDSSLQSQSQQYPFSSSDPLSSISPGSVLERWMFDVSRFPSWPGGAKAIKTFERVIRNEGKREESRDRPGSAFITSQQGGNVSWPDVDEQLRGALRRMTYAAEKMDPLPEGCTFTVAVELRDEGVAPIGYPQAWIPSQPNLQPESRHIATQGDDLGGAKTTPIRSVGAGPLYFECWLEEGKAKKVLSARATYEDPP